MSLPVVGTALVLIDVINDLAFPGSEVLVAQAGPLALRLAVLKRRTAAAGVLVIFCVLFTANDAHMRDLKVYAPADCIVSNTHR